MGYKKRYKRYSLASSQRYHKRWYNYWWRRYLKRREKKCVQRFNYHADVYKLQHRHKKRLSRYGRKQLWLANKTS